MGTIRPLLWWGPTSTATTEDPETVADGLNRGTRAAVQPGELPLQLLRVEKVQAITGEKTWQGLGQERVTTDVSYPMAPPTGGDHHPDWQNCEGNAYGKPVPAENVVHSLEHGAVWVTYTDKTRAADVKTLAERVSRTPYTLMSPYSGQTAPITLTA